MRPFFKRLFGFLLVIARSVPMFVIPRLDQGQYVMLNSFQHLKTMYYETLNPVQGDMDSLTISLEYKKLFVIFNFTG
jgi:hypothetical protein